MKGLNALDDPSSDLTTASLRRWMVLLLVVFGVTILVVRAGRYWPFISDDALISLRYAMRLLDGHGLTWTAGTPVEGYSNLLWILLVSLLGFLGLDLVAASRILGFLCFAAVIGAFGYSSRLRAWRDLMPPVVGTLVVVLAAPVAIWSIGGLEQPLVAALLAWALVLVLPLTDPDGRPHPKSAVAASLCLGLLCLTRPDGGLFTLSLALGLLIVRGINRSSFSLVATIIALPIVATLGQEVFRLFYYGQWLPNPALVKVSPSWLHFFAGLDYVSGGYSALRPIMDAAVIVATLFLILRRFIGRVPSNRVIVLVLPALIWMIYVALVGGDLFPGWRHFVPVVVVAAMILIEAFRWIDGQFSALPSTIILGLIAVVGLVSFVQRQDADPENQRAIHERFEFDGQVIGLMLKNGFGPSQPVAAVSAAGCIPYWSELPSIDMLGLNDDYLPHHRPEDFGQGWIGHELRDDNYIFARRPDLVIFHTGSGEGLRVPGFRHEYTLTTFLGREPHEVRSKIWVRMYSEKIGIISEENSITIPSYLFDGNTMTSFLDGNGVFVVTISDENPISYYNLPLSAGTWTIEAAATSPLQVAITRYHDGVKLADGPLPRKLVLENATRITSRLTPAQGGSSELRNITITRE